MGSRFSAEFAAGAVSDLMYQFGQALTYTPSTGSETSPWGVFHEDESSVRDTPDGREVVRSGTLNIGDDPSMSTYLGIASPAEDDVVTVEGVTWSVDVVGEHNGGLWSLGLTRIESIEKTQAGYRDEA